MFQKHQPEPNLQQALESSLNNDIQFGVQKRGRRESSFLEFCNLYDGFCKPSLAAEQEATCKKTTAIAVEKEAGLCRKTTAIAVEKEAGLCKKSTAIAVEKKAGLCKNTTANAVKMAVEKTVEKEAGLCKKSTAIAVENEAKSCKKSIADAVTVEKEKEATWCKKNSVMVEKVGPIKPSLNNRIGEITKYYHNYEFSIDLRFRESELQTTMSKQILVGIV